MQDMSSLDGGVRLLSLHFHESSSKMNRISHLKRSGRIVLVQTITSHQNI